MQVSFLNASLETIVSPTFAVKELQIISCHIMYTYSHISW